MDGKMIKELRKRRNLTQQELAERAGTTHAAISQIEAGNRQPRKDLRQRLARALDVSVDELMWSRSSLRPEDV